MRFTPPRPLRKGASGTAADIIISREDEVVRDVQAKLFTKATGALHELCAEKYDGMQRLVPLDQEAKIRDLLARRLEMDCLVALNLALGAKLERSSLPAFDEFMSDRRRPLQL